MNIFMLTVGSRGDVQPFIALGQGLMSVGHRVTVCTSRRFEPFIRRHGLRYGFMSNGLLDLMDSPEGRTAIETTTGLFGTLRTTVRLAGKAKTINRRLMLDSWAAAQAAAPDLILFHPKGLGGRHIAEKLSVPAMLVLPAPMMVPTGAYPLMGLPGLNLGARFNRASYRLVGWGYRIYNDTVKAFRKDILGLDPGPRSMGLLQTADGQPVPVLHCFSPLVFPRPADWPTNAHVTGYWFLAPTDTWRPPAELDAFLSAGDAPVYVGFGSMAGRRPRQLAGLVVEALQQANQRGIIAAGGGGITTGRLPGTILKIEDAPHDWLFPRAAAVVHHGGAGTTAAGLRAGRPTVVCPFIADQPFWGRRIHELGLGPEPIPQRKLTTGKLKRALRVVTRSETIKENAATFGRRIRKEDGIARAMGLIEATLRRSKNRRQEKYVMP